MLTQTLQRAFRQRKEGYIKKLEERVKDLESMEQNFRALQNENYQLREYILTLQSRLLETSSDVPAAPLQVNLRPTTRPDEGSDSRFRRDMLQHSESSKSRSEEAEARPARSTYGLGSRESARHDDSPGKPAS